MKLKQFLDKEGEKAEFDSLREYSDKNSFIKLSKSRSLFKKIDWLIGMLDEIYEVEGDEKKGYSLKLQSNKQEHE